MSYNIRLNSSVYSFHLTVKKITFISFKVDDLLPDEPRVTVQRRKKLPLLMKNIEFGN